ncbi:seizure protein 6 homolog [Rhincodon typus]|uniref:seizure protein 6 homolog n=1 Tax=Rhincodon typus TaxID=259920 RepID=UPI002030B2C2|nr:seizure protein 6 homolog [Rhincodon typus]
MNKNLFSPYRLKMSTLCLLLACLMTVYGQDLSKDLNTVSGKGKSNDKTEIVWTTATTTEPEDKFHFVSTTPNININNHHPLLEEIIHETLLKKDFLGQEPLFTNKIGMRIGATFPATQSQKPQDPLVHHVVTNDTPFFSDITTTTMASTSPMTTLGTSSSLATDAAPLADHTGVTQGGKTPPMLRMVATTDSLTTSAVSSATSELPETAFPNSITAFVQTEPGRPSTVTGEPQSKSGIFQHFSNQGVATAVTGNPPTAITPTVGAGTHQMQGLNTEQHHNPAADPTVSSVASETDEETTTTTIITTTIITTVQTPVPCSLNFTDFEGYIESPEYLSHLYYSNLDCIYTITVYRGYGVELQVKNISLSEGEMLTIEGLDGNEPTVLANESILMKGQVIRSPSNQVSIHFQSIQLGNPGSFQFHYQAYLLSCGFPQKPSFGDVSVTSLHPGGVAHFYCNTGYHLQGFPSLTCVNGSKPRWSDNEPECIATCGGFIRNATVGRITSPNFPGNYSNNLTCYWLIEAPEGQKLHLHFEKVALAEDDDRVIIRNGDSIDAPSVYDSYEVEYLPIEGIVSDSQHFFIELTTDSSGTSTGLALRYEGSYRLNMGQNDVLTFYDGDDLTARLLGQYTGTHHPFKLYTTMADVTIQFQSDPATNVFGYQQGFVIHFYEVLRNDTCPEVPEILNGWKTTSHPELIHGTVVTYQCYPGFELIGTDILMCQWDLSWSGDPPTCEKIIFCTDPGDVDHSRKIIADPKFSIGSTVQYICNKGYTLAGSNILTCYNRQSGNPKWSDRVPKCIPEVFEPCHNPGVPDNGYQTTEKRLYQAGEALRFACYDGYELKGEANIKCIPGHPSEWSNPPPFCKVTFDKYFNERRLEVAKPASSLSQMQGSHIAIAVFIPMIIVALLIAAIYFYFTKFQGKSTLRLPLAGPHPYNHITVESAFDNPIYETGVSNEPLQLRDLDPENTPVLT